MSLKSGCRWIVQAVAPTHLTVNHLTPGLTEVRVYAAGFTSFLAGFFRAGDLAGIPALKTW